MKEKCLRRVRILLVVLVVALPALADKPLVHSGVVVDAANEKPLEKVDATAYGGNERKEGGLCPAYADPLHQVRTDAEGRFTFRVAPEKPSYVVTYCLAGYVPRTEVANENSVDASPVEPQPVRLLARKSLPRQMTSAIKGARDAAKARTNALYRQNAPGFMSALQNLRFADRQIVMEWTDTGRATAPKPETEAIREVSRIVEQFRTSLEYFRDADPKQFKESVQSFGEIGRYMDALSCVDQRAFVIRLWDRDATGRDRVVSESGDPCPCRRSAMQISSS